MAPTIVKIGSLDQEGRGIARVDGKAVFVDGGLPGETVTITTLKRKPTFDLARATAVLKPNAARVDPRCPHFGVCGGCSQQHFDAGAQVAAKQRTLEDALWRLGRVRPGLILPPVHGPAWEYRHRARLSVRHVVKKGGVLIGFHERMSSYVADMTSCAVLPRRISDLLPKLRALIGGLSVRDRLPQIELAVGDGADAAHVLVLRILEPITADGRVRAGGVRRSARRAVLPAARRPRHRGASGSGATVARLRCSPNSTSASPTRPRSSPRSIRRSTVCSCGARWRCSIPRPGERIADFFCGIGNFTLPIARRGATVVGVEGSATLVARAAENRRLQRARGERHVSGRQSVRRDAREHRGAGTAGQDSRRPAARRRDRARQGAAGRRSAAPDRLRLVQPGDARARRLGAGARPRLRPRRGRRDQHVSAHVARRIDRPPHALNAAGRKQSGRLSSPRSRCVCLACGVSRAAP